MATVDPVQLERAPLFADSTLKGARWCDRHSKLIDEWLASLFAEVAGEDVEGTALVAVGGYGRSELCPQSDLDLMLLRSPRRDAKAISERIWYPIWDAGLKLGHSVCTAARSTRDRRRRSRHRNRAAERAAHRGRRVTHRRSRRGRALALGATCETMARSAPRTCRRARMRRPVKSRSCSSPISKKGRGGLRDVHSLQWAQAARSILLEHDEKSLATAYATLLDRARRAAPPNGPAEQRARAAGAGRGRDALDLADGDALMASIASAARAIAWTSDDAWRRIRSSLRGPLGRIGKRDRVLGDGLALRDGEVHIAGDVDPAADALLALRAARFAAEHGTVIDRDSLERLAASAPALGDPWPPDARDLLVGLFAAGAEAIPVIEALDHRGVWTRILPEWEPVRSRPQRNSYHRFTVDRHLLETVANAAARAGQVDRPDLLVMSALLHDLGKGTEGDHTEAGVEIARRLGYAARLPGRRRRRARRARHQPPAPLRGRASPGSR